MDFRLDLGQEENLLITTYAGLAGLVETQFIVISYELSKIQYLETFEPSIKF